MLMVFRLIIFFYFISSSICTNSKVSERIEKDFNAQKSYKSEYLSKEIGSYSRGGVQTQSAVTTQHGHESGTSKIFNPNLLKTV